MATPVIETQNVYRIYEGAAGYTPALRGISLTVPRGEFLAIMGPSGSGKSTLMNILGCLDRPTTGTYRLQGIDVSDLSDDDLAHVRSTQLGLVFQSFNLLPRASVMRNVILPLLYSPVDPRERELRAIKALRAVDLPEEYWDHGSNELSGGQVQRVAIARALVADPPLLLADEPTGNLDTATGEMVMRTFLRLKARDKTVVLITHDAEVAAWADRTVHIRDGRLLTAEEERAFVERTARGARAAAGASDKDAASAVVPAGPTTPAPIAGPREASAL